MPELLAAASSDRILLRTARRSEAMAVLANAGATVSSVDREVLTVAGLDTARVVALLADHGLPFSELAQHHASLEEAYMELTKDAVEYGDRPAVERPDPQRPDLQRPDLQRPGRDRADRDDADRDRPDADRLGADRLGADRLGADRLGADRLGADPADADRGV